MQLEEFLFQFGYIGLFIISFAAATIFPLGSEVFVIMMIAAGYNSWIVFFIASLGNSIGSLVNYYAGKLGAEFILSRFIKTKTDQKSKAEKAFQKWGSPVLFFAWLPVIGDPLTFVAGILKINIKIFLFWVVSGKCFRYAFIIMTMNKV